MTTHTEYRIKITEDLHTVEARRQFCQDTYTKVLFDKLTLFAADCSGGLLWLIAGTLISIHMALISYLFLTWN